MYSGCVLVLLMFKVRSVKIVFVMVPAEYCQEIPQNKPWEKVPGPPILPPHLLQVILNKDTPLSVSYVVGYTHSILSSIILLLTFILSFAV